MLYIGGKQYDHPITRSSALLCAFLWLLLSFITPVKAQEIPAQQMELDKLFEQGRYDSALTVAKGYFEAAKRDFGDKSPQFAAALHRLGLALRKTGEFYQAGEYIKQHCDLQKELNGELSVQYALALNHLGVFYTDIGDYTEAEARLVQAGGILTYLGEEGAEYTAVLNNLANALYHGGEPEKALTMYNRVLERKEKTAGYESISTAITLNNISVIYRVTGRFGAAEDLLKRAAEIFESQRGADHPYYARTMHNLAMLFAESGRYDSAETYFLRTAVLRSALQGSDHPDYARTITELVDIYLKNGRNAEADVLMKQSAGVLQMSVGSEHPDYIVARALQGRIALAVGDWESAGDHFRFALIEGRKVLGEDHPQYTNIMLESAFYYVQRDSLDRAAELLTNVMDNISGFTADFFDVLSTEEQLLLLEKNNDMYCRILAAAFLKDELRKKLAPALLTNRIEQRGAILQKSRRLHERAEESGMFRADYEQLLTLKSQLLRLYRLPSVEREKSGADPNRIRELIIALERNLAASEQNIVRINAGQPVDDLQKLLFSDEAVIEISRFTYEQKIYYAAFIIKGSEPGIRTILKDDGAILETSAIEYYRFMLAKQQQDNESFNAFWKEIYEATANCRTVYYAADGVYHLVNPETFLLSEGSYLVDKQTFQTITNWNRFSKTKGEKILLPTEGTALLVGNPEFKADGENMPDSLLATERGLGETTNEEGIFFNLNSLPGTGAEIEGAAAILDKTNIKTEIYQKEKATEHIIKSVTNPVILHIATHGFFLGEKQLGGESIFGFETAAFKQYPLLRSGLFLAGAFNALMGRSDTDNLDEGILTAFETGQLKLSNTKLVILSACETGLGKAYDGEGIFGLQRSFFIAGASSVLMSLWKIDDSVTAEYITLLYKYWSETSDLQKSIDQARASIREKYKHPYYWGALKLIKY